MNRPAIRANPPRFPNQCAIHRCQSKSAPVEVGWLQLEMRDEIADFVGVPIAIESRQLQANPSTMLPGNFSNHAGPTKQLKEFILMFPDLTCTIWLLLVDVCVLTAACARERNHHVNTGFLSRGHR